MAESIAPDWRQLPDSTSRGEAADGGIGSVARSQASNIAIMGLRRLRREMARAAKCQSVNKLMAARPLIGKAAGSGPSKSSTQPPNSRSHRRMAMAAAASCNSK